MRRKKKIDLWNVLDEITSSEYSEILSYVENYWYDLEDWDIEDFHSLLDGVINNLYNIFPKLYVARVNWWDFEGSTMVYLLWIVQTPEGEFTLVVKEWDDDYVPHFETYRELADYIVGLWNRYLDINCKFRAMTSHIKYTYVD